MKYKDYENIIRDLELSQVSVFSIGVAYEIKCCLEYQNKIFTEEEKEKLFNNVYNAYLKSSEVDLNSLVWVCINHFDELDELGGWDLVQMSFDYEN